MSFRENLVHLRAANNMTQEQLAMLCGVSRQAVTKWESEKSYPEMDKLLKMCQAFNCTLDDLVQGDLTGKDSAFTAVLPPTPPSPPVDVFDYDAQMRRFGLKVPLGIAALIFFTALSLPIFGASDPDVNPLFFLPENIAAALGTLCVFIGVAILLACVIPAGLSHAQFVREHPYIEDFYTKDEKAKARSAFSYQLIGGIVCIFIGVCTVMLFGEDSENIFGVSIMLILIALGVFLIVHGAMTLGRTDITHYNMTAADVLEPSEIENASMPEPEKQALLRSKAQSKTTDKRIGAACGTIMIIATIVAFLLLFVPLASGTGDHSSGAITLFWLPWPIGGMFCGIVALLIKGFSKSE